MAFLTCKSPDLRGFFFLSLLWTAICPALAPAVDGPDVLAVRCEADYGGHTEKLALPPTTDVYATQTVELSKRFRFGAQFLANREKLKTWVYELRERGPLLLHAAEYPLSADACVKAGTGTIDFGLNKVYSSDFERELFFRCVSTCP
ncbi:MAG: hypothetical protein RL404_595 [Pseudomonadota bacterium]